MQTLTLMLGGIVLLSGVIALLWSRNLDEHLRAMLTWLVALTISVAGYFIVSFVMATP